MKIMWKTFLAVSAYWAGVFGWFYIGVWQVLKKPVHSSPLHCVGAPCGFLFSYPGIQVRA